MKYKLGLGVLLLMMACGKSKPQKTPKTQEVQRSKIATVEITPLLEDSLLNVRAIETEFLGLSAASSKGDVFVMDSNMHTLKSLEWNYPDEDSLVLPNFRSLAYNGTHMFAMSIGSPALLFKDGEVVYEEAHPKAFYDALKFWNRNEGIAIGDPTDGCMSIIITRDGGSTWTKLPCDALPEAKEGEAAFAASDTNIAIIGNHTWVATGGKASRILYSADKGLSWTVYETPVVQGKETTGIYSIDFYDAEHGFAIGGDYTAPEETQANKLKTADGGKTWSVVGQGQAPGYRSCVQYRPGSDAKELVVVGFKGIDYSADGGNTWKHLSDEGFYTLRFLNDSIAYAGGKGRISKLHFKN